MLTFTLYLATYLLPPAAPPMGSLAMGVGVPIAAAATGEGVSLRLGRNSITADQTVTLEMSVTTSGHGSADSIQSPDLSDFEVLRQSSSQQISIVNFNVSKTQVHTYVLRPKRTGTIEIGPAVVRIDDRTLRSEVVRLLVRDAGTGSGGAGPGTDPGVGQIPGFSFPADPLGQGLPDQPGVGDHPNLTGDTEGEDVLLLAETSNTKVYVGQAVLLNYNLATLIDLTEYRAEEPVLDGFWVETVQRQSQRPVFRKRDLGNRTYHVGEISQHVLYPLRPGKLTIPGVPFQVAVTTDFFGFGRQRLTGKSNSVTVEVLPLPTENVPDHFTGAVGQFTIAGRLKAGRSTATTSTATSIATATATDAGKTILTAGQPATFTIVLSGSGNFRQFKAPALPAIKGFRIHEPTVNDSLTVTGQGLSGTRAMEYIMVPEAEGTLTIPPVQFSYFDPSARAWRTVKSEPLSVEVSPGQGQAVTQSQNAGELKAGGSGVNHNTNNRPHGGPLYGPGNSPANGSNMVDWNDTSGSLGNTVPGWIDENGEPYKIQPIKLRTTLEHMRKSSSPPYTRWPFWALLAGLPLLWAFLIMSDALREAQTRNLDRIRVRKAYARAKRRLREAEDHIHDSQPAGFFHEISRALHDYLQDKLGLQVGGMTTSSLRISMEARGYPGSVVDALIEELENCDYARFAPGSGTPVEMTRSLSRAREILDSLEQFRPAKSATASSADEKGRKRMASSSSRHDNQIDAGQSGPGSSVLGVLLTATVTLTMLHFLIIGQVHAANPGAQGVPEVTGITGTQSLTADLTTNQEPMAKALQTESADDRTQQAQPDHLSLNQRANRSTRSGHDSSRRNRPANQGASLQDYFERGNERYYQGDYAGAIADYTRIQKYGVEDAALLYNLGNAWLMSGRPGNAIFYYDRALWLAPRASDIRHNLETAEAMAVRQQQTKSENPDGSGSGMVTGESSWLLWLSPLRFFTPTEMTVAFVVLYVTLFIILLLRRRSRHGSSARPLLGATAIFLAIAIAATGLFMTGNHIFRYRMNMAVITNPIEAILLEGPTSAARLVSRVGEGSRVLIVDRAPGGWLKIRAGAHTEGWLQANQLGQI